MKLILLGNAGAGKSALARKLISQQPAARLSLDEVAFDSGTERCALQDSLRDVRRFILDHASWIIEGCYADIIAPVLPECEALVFLNTGVEVCVAHCRARSWEPEKYPSARLQDEHLENLVAWVRSYETRDDEFGLRAHRVLYESFPGSKWGLRDPSQYASVWQRMQADAEARHG